MKGTQRGAIESSSARSGSQERRKRGSDWQTGGPDADVTTIATCASLTDVVVVCLQVYAEDVVWVELECREDSVALGGQQASMAGCVHPMLACTRTGRQNLSTLWYRLTSSSLCTVVASAARILSMSLMSNSSAAVEPSGTVASFTASDGPVVESFGEDVLADGEGTLLAMIVQMKKLHPGMIEES